MFSMKFNSLLTNITEFSKAFAFDELNELLRVRDPVFKGFKEGRIDFPPTQVFVIVPRAGLTLSIASSTTFHIKGINFIVKQFQVLSLRKTTPSSLLMLLDQ